ncbi:MAG: D-alanyl-D-alanine carboxypeptidase/D-alanyl-D-alanine-endopeptidase, partial [Betaproteobacteria bacterium]|nr:D-alanyl-D-alanine carboxypeptidase/D-alanyl-D-alanine-endopeptidase [Betaproteobacteria bacterium]
MHRSSSRSSAARVRRPLLWASILLFAAAALVGGTARAQSRLPPALSQALSQAGIPETAVGLYVHEIGAGEPVLAVGAARALNPASTMKLVTTYAALELLGPAYTWPTEIYATGPLAQEVLNGDLVIKGYGDPRLTIEDFWLLLREIRSRGVREIRGDLVLDRSHFAANGLNASAFDGEPTRPYNTGPDALLVNFKAVRLTFIPEPESRSVRITVEPPLRELAVANKIKLDNAPCGDWETRLKLDPQDGAGSARLAFTGSFSMACGERVRHYSVLGHPQYVASLFQELWRELGGTFAGKMRDGEASAGAQLLARAHSPALAEIVRDINKFSNNVMARQLFLTLGAEGDGPPGTTDKANRVVRQWLAQKGLTMPELVIENGSGLSRIERISAQSLGRLLLAAFSSPLMPEFIASLPLAAVDGTMKKRLNGAPVAGQ